MQLSVCVCKKFTLDPLDDHVRTSDCTVHSRGKKAHDWTVETLADWFRTTHRVKTQQVPKSGSSMWWHRGCCLPHEPKVTVCWCPTTSKTSRKPSSVLPLVLFVQACITNNINKSRDMRNKIVCATAATSNFPDTQIYSLHTCYVCVRLPWSQVQAGSSHVNQTESSLLTGSSHMSQSELVSYCAWPGVIIIDRWAKQPQKTTHPRVGIDLDQRKIPLQLFTVRFQKPGICVDSCFLDSNGKKV